jgi:serine kinase of HPr protein (carbohydrate metabolism regulator)
MEVRGIGVINVSSIFGVGSVRAKNGSIRLDAQGLGGQNVDRIGLDREFYEILGIKIPRDYSGEKGRVSADWSKSLRLTKQKHGAKQRS